MAKAEQTPGPVAVALAGMLSLAVAMGIGRFAFTPMLPLMIAGGQLDVTAGGWVAAANYAGYLLGGLTASRLPLAGSRLALAALALTVVLTAAMALPMGIALWAGLRLAAGVSSAWAFVGTSVWCLAGLAARGRTGLASVVYAGVGSGIVIAGLACLAGGAVREEAPRMWLWLAVLATVLTVPVVLVIGRMGTPQIPHASAAPAASHTGTAAGTTVIVLCYGALGFGYILPATFLPVMARSLVPDPLVFGLAWPIFGMTAVASMFVAGRALRHTTRLHVWMASNVIMGVGVLLPSVWLSGITIGLSALMVGGTFMIVTMVGVQEIRARATGDPTPLVSRMTTSFALGQIAGPIASSVMLHVPALQANGLRIALQAASISLFASAAWLWRLSVSPARPHKHH